MTGPPSSNPGERQPLLVWILAAAVAVSRLALFVGFKEENLNEALFGVEPHRQVGGVVKLDDQPSAPRGFQRRRVRHQTAAGISRIMDDDVVRDEIVRRRKTQ